MGDETLDCVQGKGFAASTMRPIAAAGENRRPASHELAPSRRDFWLAAAALGISACRRQTDVAASGAVTFALPTDERAALRQNDWRQLLAEMAAATGLKVKPFFAPSDATLLAAMRRRQVDAGWFSNPAALAAVRSANGEVFARTIPPGVAVRRAILIARKEGATLDAIRRCDRKLAYGQGPVGSMGGYLAPIAFFFGPEKLDPRRCFREVVTIEGDGSLRAVADGRLDVAAIDTDFLARGGGLAPAALANASAIWTSPPLPQDPIIWRRDLDPDAKERLRQFFIAYGRGQGTTAERQRAVLAPLDVGGFEVADDNQLLLAREMEARERLALAEWSGDAARTQGAQRVVDAIAAERQAYEDRQPAPPGTP